VTPDVAAAPAQADAAVRSLIHAYVRNLDQLKIAEWEDFFAAEAYYEVNSRENIERGLSLAHVLDHTRDRIHDRVTYILDVWEGHYNSYWPRHIIGEPVETGREDGLVYVETPFAMYITEAGSIGSRLLAVGNYEDVITFEDDRPKFRSKRVVLDTTVMPRYFVYPI
jgi:3-phenylpropionate/cinnamic acid dioxygenase small subunit